MKRLLMILLLGLVLCGCGAEPQVEETTLPTETEIVDPTEPSGCYDPNSQLEAQTKGGVRVYPLNIENSYFAVNVGADLVVFSGTETTTLTMLSGENLYTTARVEIGSFISPLEPSTQVTQKGISYYSPASGEVVLLDTALKEVAQIEVPEDIVGVPVLSANRQFLYYCTADAIRVLELENGISRLLKQISWPGQTVEGLLLEDTVLRCGLVDDQGEAHSIFISTGNGEILWESWEPLTVSTYENTYYAKIAEGAMDALVFGQVDGSQRMLLPRDVMAESWYLETMNALVTASGDGKDSVTLEYYDLSSGLRSSVLELANSSYPMSVTAGPVAGLVDVLCYDEELEVQVLYRWDTAAMATNDSEPYTGPRYTLENQDTEALSACRAYATELNQRYGVEILISNAATEVQPWDYSLETEYQAPLIQRDLELLEKLLAAYPDGFLKATADSTESGVIRICLVRSITGTPQSGNVDSSSGIQFWAEEAPYVALCVGSMTDKVVYHAMFHAIETKVYSDSQIYYEWDNLNPDGFEYDYHFDSWKDREESEYLQDADRAFIDSYAMTFPREDRARIMEYAMAAGNEGLFQSEIMQEKLYQLCLGIRKAYGLTKSEETYLWEQYLTESLAYVPEE